MKLSLQSKVSLATALIIVTISVASTYLFITAHKRSKEKGRVLRGGALSYALSKAAEEGLIKEDLNLIKKASSLIQAPDVTLVQVYSNIWDIIDAYPFSRFKQPPHPDAVNHFRNDASPFHVAIAGGYDFYTPILFKAYEDSPPIAIGYVRLTLSAAEIRQEVREIIITNVAVSAVITLVAILSINSLIGRFVVKPVMLLHRSVTDFKNGIMTAETVPPRLAADELRDLAREFNLLFRTLKDKEARLIESDRRIRSLFDRVEHGIFRLDGNGSLIEANERFKALFGDVTGLCDILLGEKSAVDCLRRAADEGALHLEDKAVGRNGAELMVSLSLYPEKDGTGAVAGFDGYIIDVTEKKRLEERLIRAQKMEAIGTLAGGMAHEFNNLLTAVLGYSGMLLKAVDEESPLYKPLSVINEAAKRGAELGRRILTITRKERVETRQVDINDIVNSALELFHRSLPKNIEIVTRLADRLPVTIADPSQMQQVIINLVVNARDAMPKGGRLVIETSLAAAPGSAGVDSTSAPGGFIKLSVADNGTGIPSKMQDKIFDPFFTTKEVGKGTGLGLYIVHSIVTNHGGYVNLYSELSRGTQFNIYLPVIAPGKAAAPPEIMDVTGSGTILIIDDEPDVREICRDILGALGYSVLLAGNGIAGEQLYREKKGQIVLVILDMVMPKMSGPEVFDALKNYDPSVRVLLYSGYSNSSLEAIDDLLKRGAAGFIQKPFSPQDLGAAVKNALS